MSQVADEKKRMAGENLFSVNKLSAIHSHLFKIRQKKIDPEWMTMMLNTQMTKEKLNFKLNFSFWIQVLILLFKSCTLAANSGSRWCLILD